MIICQHSLEEMRRRIGERADHLVHAIGRGSPSATALLERETRTDIAFQDMRAGRTIVTMLQMDGAHWAAHQISIPRQLPDTVIAAASGRRLGDVLASEHNGDMLVTSIVATDAGVEINVMPTLVDTDGLRGGGFRFDLGLRLETLRAYATAPGYQGLGGGMTDLVMAMIGVITLAALALTADMLLPGHTTEVLAVTAFIAATAFLWPVSDWKERVRRQLRGQYPVKGFSG